MKDIIKKYNSVILLAVIIVIQLIYSTVIFATKKMGYHSDEICSYGLSNSYYQPYVFMDDNIYVDDIESEDIRHFGEWTDSQVYNDYITVQQGERFSYASVYHNQALDHHPPLYYFILHTICSFFPDSFSPYYALFINLVSMAVIQIYLFKLVKLMSKSEKTALCCCLLYGAGTGALSTVIFLRQYCFITMLLVMYVYYSACVYGSMISEQGKMSKPALVGVGISSFCLFLANYSVVAFCGVYTASMCIYLLCRKKIKYMFSYGLTMLGTLCASFAAFPYIFKHVLGYSGAHKASFPFMASIYRISNFVLSQSVGIGVSALEDERNIYYKAALFIVVIFIVLLCFLFRKSAWFKKLSGMVRQKFKSFAEFRKLIVKRLRTANYTCLFIVLSSLALIVVTARTVDIVDMGYYTRRYIFMLYPMVCAVSVYLIHIASRHLPKIKKHSAAALLTVCVLIAARVNISFPCMFYFTNSDSYTDLAELAKDTNVVIFVPKGWIQLCYSTYVRDCDNVFFTDPDNIDEHMEAINEKKVSYAVVPFYSVDLSFLSDDEFDKVVSPIDYIDADQFFDDSDRNREEDERPLVEEEDALNKKICSFNGGCDFKPLSVMVVQGSLMLVCEIK